jgi:hypothetical protein
VHRVLGGTFSSFHIKDSRLYLLSLKPWICKSDQSEHIEGNTEKESPIRFLEDRGESRHFPGGLTADGRSLESVHIFNRKSAYSELKLDNRRITKQGTLARQERETSHV